MRYIGNKINLLEFIEKPLKENGVKEQTVLIEFESLEKALQAYEIPEYQEALKALDGGADRDFRIFEEL